MREGLELLPEFKAVKDSYSGKSLRKGAASAMLYHERCSMADAILRGGWKLSAFNTIFEYISVDLGPITYAGRALANYPYPRRNYPSPKCNFINEMDSDQKNRFNSFLTYLFVISVPGMNVDGHLWPLAYLLIATFLKDMDHMITEYGDSHIVNKKVYDAAKSNGWLKADLNKWSIRVKEDYRKDNLIDLGGENIVHNLNETVRSMRADISDISGRINLLERVSREAARELEQSMTEMRANNSELKSSILELNEMIKGIVKNSTRSPISPYPPSSTHSRKRTSTTMDAETTLIKTSIQTSDSIEDNVSTSSSTSSSHAAPAVLNAMEMMMK